MPPLDHPTSCGGPVIRLAAPPCGTDGTDTATADRADGDGRETVADRVIVGFQPNVTDAEKDAVHRAMASATAVNPVPVTRVGDTAQSSMPPAPRYWRRSLRRIE